MLQRIDKVVLRPCSSKENVAPAEEKERWSSQGAPVHPQVAAAFQHCRE